MRIRLLASVMTLFMLFACSEEHHQEPTVQMPVSLIIPSGGLITRMPGDPGTYEKFCQPEYLYLYLVVQKTDGTTSIRTLEQRLTSDWDKTTLSGTGGDSVYRYKGTINLPLDESPKKYGKIYAAVSCTPLELTGDTPKTEEDIKNITLRLTDENLSHIQDIYSSPYNLEETVNNIEQYYGTIKEINSPTPHVDLMLYHVAAKVDLIWNVKEELQPEIRLIKMKLENLSRTGYLFRPNENLLPAEETYTQEIGINIGNQWLGRSYIYTLPYSDGGSYPLTISLWRAGEDPDGTAGKPAVSLGIPYQTDYLDPFTHWMRGNIYINGW